MRMTPEQLRIRSIRSLTNQCCNAGVRLSNLLQDLSTAASEMYGRPLHADMCNGFEIEFRNCDEDGYGIDDMHAISLEDVISEYNRRNGRENH